MIDLSYLTEEEQGAIMTVLKRDAELKKAEEERIKYTSSLFTLCSVLLVSMSSLSAC